MQSINLLILLLGMVFQHKAPVKYPEWVSPEAAENILLTENKPVIINIYTNWCGWCKLMDKKTWRSPELISYVNEKFAAVKFNAEGNALVKWSNREFILQKGKRTHDFALYISGGRLSYPTLIIIPAAGMEPQIIPGYLTPGEIEPVLKYFGEGYWKKEDYASFLKRFKNSWK